MPRTIKPPEEPAKGNEKMEISDITGEVETIAFWPAIAVREAFEEAGGANGSPNELERLRSFYCKMKFFYDIAASSSITIPPRKINALYEYAKKGLGAEAQDIRPETIPENKRTTQKRRGNNGKP